MSLCSAELITGTRSAAPPTRPPPPLDLWVSQGLAVPIPLTDLFQRQKGTPDTVSQDQWYGVTFKDMVEGEGDRVPTVPEPQALGEATGQGSGSAVILSGRFAALTPGPDTGRSKEGHPPALLFWHRPPAALDSRHHTPAPGEHRRAWEEPEPGGDPLAMLLMPHMGLRRRAK